MSNAQMDLYETEYFLLYQNLEVSLTHNFRHHFPFQKKRKNEIIEEWPAFRQYMGCLFFR